MSESQEQIEKRKMDQIKFFQKRVIENKPLDVCCEEIGVSPKTLYNWQTEEGGNFRQMALVHLEDKIHGVSGVVGKLIKALDATRPLVITDKKTDAKGHINEITRIEQVADQATRMKALQEIIKIYGLQAPQKRDVAVTVSISTDAALFAEIDEVERSCKYVDSYVKVEGSFEVAPDPQGKSHGNFESRKRTVLQGTAVSK